MSKSRVANDIILNDRVNVVPSSDAPHGTWAFDSATADEFDTIARKNIPNYETVIQKCVHVAESAFPDKKAVIIDVGSATGYTLDRFEEAGFEFVYGVENSEAMIRHCKNQTRVILSDSFPSHLDFDMVLANWTLHFIRERDEYLADIFAHMREGGILILTDKMQASPFVHDRYHDFKRAQGLTEEQIQKKQAAIEGVLVPYSLEWYLDTLKGIGFREATIIDGSWGFVSLLCFK